MSAATPRLERTAHIAEILEAGFVIVSVLFIWYELRLNNDLSKAANAQALVEQSSPFNLELAVNPELAGLWIQGRERFAEMDEVDRYRYQSMVTWWLIFHENVFYQRRHGLLDEQSHQAWDRDLRAFVRGQRLGPLWKDVGPFYQDEFAAYVTRLIEAP